MIFYCGSITFNDDRKMITMMLIFTNRPIKVKEKGWMAKGKMDGWQKERSMEEKEPVG